MRVVAISDTHSSYEDLILPAGDVLVHAGDIAATDSIVELVAFNIWLGKQPHKYKVVIGGNHDGFLETNPSLIKGVLTNAIYLENSGCEIEGIKFWGSPISPAFNNWFFQAERIEEIKRYWDMIPENTDVLITHSPPSGILDYIDFPKREHLGCFNLFRRVAQIRPKCHIFGHIHNGYGIKEINGVKYVNASLMDEEYNLTNKPIVIEIN